VAPRQQQPWATRTKHDRRDAYTRAVLLKAAGHVFAQRGYGPTTIAAITAEAGLSRAAFYVYFASKAEVFRVLAWQVRDAFLTAQEVPGTDPDDPYAVARASVGAFIAAYARHLPLLGLFEQRALADEEVAGLWAELQRRPLHRHARYVRRLAEAGQADPVVDPLSLARAVGSMSATWAALVAADPDAYEDAVHDVTTMYLHLLRVSPDTAHVSGGVRRGSAVGDAASG
jgi:AcrR family transcriptional regulator